MEYRSQLTPPVLKLLRAGDFDVDDFVRRYELPKDAIDRREVILPLDVWHRFSTEAMKVLGDEALGLHIAQMAPRGSYGVLEFATRSAPTLEEAFALIRRYSTLVNSVAVFDVKIEGGLARFTQRFPGVPVAAGAVGNIFSMAVVVRVSRELTGHEFKPSELWFGHDEPRPVDEIASWFGMKNIRFDAGENGFSFPAEWMKLPVVSADPELLAVLEEQAKSLSAGRAKPVDLKSQVEEQVRRLLRDGEPVIGAVAKQLGTSARTLQRRLSAQKVTFNDLVDEVRASTSKELLKNADLALGEIAFLLGYSEMSPFVRAFKRWTGTTPGEYRQSSR